MLILSTGVVLQFLSCTPQTSEIPPAFLQPFLDQVRIVEISSGEQFSLDTPLEAGKGHMLLITLVPAANLPTNWQGREVSSVADWQVELTLRPVKEFSLKKQIYNTTGYYHCLPLLSEKIKPFSQGGGVGWSKAGFDHTEFLRGKPKEFLQGHHWAGYYAFHDHPPGEYVYEMAIYPAYRDLSAVRYEVGPRVVVQRGIVQIL